MHLVVHACDGGTEGLDTGRRAVLSERDGHVDGGGALEASLDIVLDLRSALAQVGPLLGLLEEAKLGRSLRAPDDAGGGAGGVQAGVGKVAGIGSAELTVDLGTRLCQDKRWLVFFGFITRHAEDDSI